MYSRLSLVHSVQHYWCAVSFFSLCCVKSIWPVVSIIPLKPCNTLLLCPHWTLDTAHSYESAQTRYVPLHWLVSAAAVVSSSAHFTPGCTLHCAALSDQCTCASQFPTGKSVPLHTADTPPSLLRRRQEAPSWRLAASCVNCTAATIVHRRCVISLSDNPVRWTHNPCSQSNKQCKMDKWTTTL